MNNYSVKVAGDVANRCFFQASGDGRARGATIPAGTTLRRSAISSGRVKARDDYLDEQKGIFVKWFDKIISRET